MKKIETDKGWKDIAKEKEKRIDNWEEKETNITKLITNWEKQEHTRPSDATQHIKDIYLENCSCKSILSRCPFFLSFFSFFFFPFFLTSFCPFVPLFFCYFVRLFFVLLYTIHNQSNRYNRSKQSNRYNRYKTNFKFISTVESQTNSFWKKSVLAHFTWNLFKN